MSAAEQHSDRVAPAATAQTARRGTGRFGSILSLDDLEPAARRRLPRPIFGFISGGVETEWSVRANREAFSQWAFMPRVLNDVSERSARQPLFGREYDAPFGVAPMGAAGLAGFRADLALARAAAHANIPFVLSGSSFIPMEAIRAANPDTWFQAYLPTARDAMAALIDRVAAAGFETLVVTVDVAVSGNRENNVRNGYSSPLRPSLRLALEGLRHPAWLAGTALKTILTDGIPHLENAAATRGVAVLSSRAARTFTRDSMCWTDMKWLRGRWKGRLLLKGILSPADAVMARDLGMDGVVVSNHGGRQLDGAIPPLRALPGIVAKAGTMTVLLDGGIRRGADVLKALALGADFVFVGRPFLYAAAIGNEAGVAHAIDILKQELRRNLALLGCNAVDEVASRVVRADAGFPVLQHEAGE